METGTPGIRKIITMVLFALSCAGLLLFLWLSFGGTVPFNPKGYRFFASFPNAGQLGTQADVRIAGVNVGKVIDKNLDPAGNRTLATIQISNKFAPIHKDSLAVLRLKTIIGETYVELTPGTPNSPMLPDGGTLSRTNVQPAVQLDEVNNIFDPATRRNFQIWQQSMAQAVHGNDQNLNSVLGNLPPFAASASDLLNVLNIQHAAVVSLVRNGGTVFAALDQNSSALQNLITSGEATFNTTAANNAALAATFRVFPTFLHESRLTFTALKSFALNTDPLIKELNPVAQALGPTLHSVRVLSPYLRNLFHNLGPLIDVSKAGLPAYRDVINGARPLLGALGPFLEQLNPILYWLSGHQQLVSDFLAQGGAAISGLANTAGIGGGGGIVCSGGQPCGHYLRQFSPLGSPGFTGTRGPNDRGNDYPPATWLADPRAFSAGGSFPGSFGLPNWDCNNAGGPKPTTSTQACWIGRPAGSKNGKIPEITQAHYSSK